MGRPGRASGNRDGARPSGKDRRSPWRMVEIAGLGRAEQVLLATPAVMRCQQEDDGIEADRGHFRQAVAERAVVIGAAHVTADIQVTAVDFGKGVQRGVRPVGRHHRRRHNAGHGKGSREEKRGQDRAQPHAGRETSGLWAADRPRKG